MGPGSVNAPNRYSGGGSLSKVTDYFYGTDPDQIYSLNRKNFIEAMVKIMEGYPDIVTLVKNKTYRYRNMKELLTYYKRTYQPN